MNSETKNQTDIDILINQIDDYFTSLEQLSEQNPDEYRKYINRNKFPSAPSVQSNENLIIEEHIETGCCTLFKNCFNYLKSWTYHQYQNTMYLA